MPYHRPEWIWYVAQLVVESTIEGQREPSLTIESVLFQAESPEAAYAKAISRCATSNHAYRNRIGAQVTQRYLGIHDIEDLQAEKMEDEQVLLVQSISMPQDDACSLVRSKDALSLFGGENPDLLHLNQ